MSKTYVGPEINVTNRPAPLLIARDPGTTETRKGVPLIGDSGTLLFGGYDKYSGAYQPGLVEASGFKRTDFNITNRVLTQPHGNDFWCHSKADIEDGLRELHDLIDDLQPSSIIALGAQAAYDLVPDWPTLTDKKPGDYSGGKTIKQAKAIIERRGYFWYPDETSLPCPLVTSVHPASCLYQPLPNRILLDLDFQRLRAHLDGDLTRRPWPDFTRVTNPADLEPVWNSELVAYDVEVKWGGAEFLCLALFTLEGEAFLAYADALGACSDWLRSDRPKLAHNGQFDRYFLEAMKGIKPGGRHEDTILGYWAIAPEIAGKKDTGREDQKKRGSNKMTRKGLNYIASVYLDVRFWKAYTSNPTKMGRLCVNDCAATMWCWEEIEDEIDSLGVRGQYERQVRKIPALIAIQRRGLKIDKDLWDARTSELGGRQARLYDESREAAETFLREHDITHRPDGSEHLWYHDARCECCFGGEKKRNACDACAGVSGTGSGGAILKKDLVLWAWRNTDVPKADLDSMKKEDLTQLLPSCRVCGGEGKIPTWDFNPHSPVQLPEILWNFLKVPKYTGPPAADEETIKEVLAWSEK